MEKIMKALLAAKNPTLNVDALLEVVNATTNPQVATEILCGLYTEPLIFSLSDLSRISENKDECRFISYDKWTDTVVYSYLKHEVISMYLPKETDIVLITLDNYKEHKVNWRSDGSTKSFDLHTGKKVEAKSEATLEEWQRKGYEPDCLVP